MTVQQRFRAQLNRNLPVYNSTQRWIGRFGQADAALMRWPPTSPDFTRCCFFLWGFVKDKFCTSSPANLQELRDRITAALALVTGNRDMLTLVWNELDYRLGVCDLY